MHDVACDIGEPVIPARVAVSKALMIEAHQVQDGRVEVVDMHRVFRDIDAKVARTATRPLAIAAVSR